MVTPGPQSERALPRQGPLVGVRVLDLTATLMGPYCTQILADMGADVIKVESAEGDTTRYLTDGRHPGMAAMFVNLNRGKRSIVLNLKDACGRKILLRLAKRADVFVHSMRLDAIQKLGIDYQEVRRIRPDVVYANLYGYGRLGPYANWAAYDDTIQGISGLAMLQAEMVGEPRYVPTVIADKVSGLTAAYAIAMALFHRERSGEGQEIEIGMFETMASFLFAEHIGGSLFVPPIGEPVYRRAVTPQRRPHRTADGYVSVLIYNDKQWRRFVAIAGAPPQLLDPRFETLASRSKHIDELYTEIGRVLETRTTGQWIELLQQAGIPAVPVNTLKDVLHDPHLEQVGFFTEADTKEGRLRFPGIPTRFSRTPGRITEAGPRLGEHTVAIMQEAGFDADEISSCLAIGVAKSSD